MLLPSLPEQKDKGKSIGPDGSFYKQPDVILLDEKQWLYIQRRYHISPRELEIVKLVCHGLINGDIAKKLNIKPGTVKAHLRSIFGKTRVRNKITMLLRFMEDASKFFSESSCVVPVAAVNGGTPHQKTTSSGEKLKKE